MDKRDIYFRHTGAVSLPGSLVMLLISVGAALVGGAAYGALVFHIPYVFLVCVLTSGFAFLLAIAVSLAAQVTHTRHATAVLVVGIVAGVVAVYGSWVGWLYAMTDWQVLILQPGQIWEAMLQLAEQGVWSLGSAAQRTKGPLLQAAWLLEAGVIVGVVAGLPYVSIRGAPYCERCRRWLQGDDEKVYTFAPLGDVEGASQALASGDLRVLGNLQPPGDEKASRTRVTLVGCEHLHLMSIDSVEVRVNEKGDRSESVRSVVRNLLLDRQSYELVGQMARERGAAQ